ncbi:MAG: hypothetical protein Ct9H300mP8_03260 [Gammaproteobacteria bacterium]|nr:MAG: hypothetical protein Ct9H300mP8_03260 [Gammaproteobacteria bacterium]
MRRIATRFRYGSWDGSQQNPLSADDVLGAIAEDLMEYGDLKWAMRNLCPAVCRCLTAATCKGYATC